MIQSAGILGYRVGDDGLEFLLVHPGGPFFARKDHGWWTIPKGEIEEGESPLETAIREFKEEIGLALAGDFTPLGIVQQKGGKIVHAWAVAVDVDPGEVVSNTFDMEWPPKSGRIGTFPEIDKAGWFRLEEAKELINERQIDFLVRAVELL